MGAHPDVRRRTAEALTRARALVAACGADLVLADAERHDEAVALVSHAPQVVASLMAARLVDADADLVALAGQGVRDVTRIAASDAALWTEILGGNAALRPPGARPARRRPRRGAAGPRRRSEQALGEDGDESPGREIAESTKRDTASAPVASGVLTELLERGARGRPGCPASTAGAPRATPTVQVVVTDQPGELARLFAAADQAGRQRGGRHHRARGRSPGRGGRARWCSPPPPAGLAEALREGRLGRPRLSASRTLAPWRRDGAVPALPWSRKIRDNPQAIRTGSRRPRLPAHRRAYACRRRTP